MTTKEFLKAHQQKIVLAVGFLLVALIAFGLGRLTASQLAAPEISVEEVFSPPLANYTGNLSIIQSEQTAGASTVNQVKCDGKIKGSSSFIYHLPGGSFYDRTTNPVRCFDTEAEAISAGFRKSTR